MRLMSLGNQKQYRAKFPSMVQRLMYIAIFRNLRGPIFLELLYVSKVIECVIEFGKVIDCFEELKTF